MLETKVDFTSLEVLARMTNTRIEAREICDRWLLLTYDIPKSQAGNKARHEFLKKARELGAGRHTDSTYLMPWTPDAEVLALQVGKVGKACVWTSQTTNPFEAKEITQKYDAELLPIIDEISERISKMEEHKRKNHRKRLEKMYEKTERMIGALERAIIRRGSNDLFILLTLEKRRLQGI